MSYAIPAPIDGMTPWVKSGTQLVAHAAYVLTAVAIYNLASTRQLIHTLLAYLLAGAGFAAVIGLLQPFLVSQGWNELADLFWNNPSYGGVVAKLSGEVPEHVAKSRLGLIRIWGPAMEPSYFGAFLVLSLLIAIGFEIDRNAQRSWVNRVGIVVGFIAVILSQARGPLLAFAVCLLGLLLTRTQVKALARRAFVAFGILAIVATGWYGGSLLVGIDPSRVAEERFGFLAGSESLYEDYSASARIAAFRMAVDMAIDYPLLGVGVGNYGFHVYDYLKSEYRYDEFRAGQWHVPYGWPATALAETGLLGAFVFCIVLVKVTMRGRDLIKRPGWTHLSGLYWGFHSLVIGGILGSNVITPYWWIALALILAADRCSKSQSIALNCAMPFRSFLVQQS